MAHTDRLGRRRHPDQHRGLRSLFPTLPADCQSRLIRVAMSATAWTRFDELVAAAAAPTAPRAVGALIEAWLAAESAQPRVSDRRAMIAPETAIEGEPSDWQAWQMRKELALLSTVRPSGFPDPATIH